MITNLVTLPPCVIPISPALFLIQRYSKPGASQEEVEAAAVAANAHKFILDLPQGYNTFIGQRGIQLSGENDTVFSLSR